MGKQNYILAGLAVALCLGSGCMISHDLYYYTKGKIIKDKDRLRIVDGHSLVLASEFVDATYDPPVKKYLFFEFNGSYPLLSIPHTVGGESLKAYFLIRQGENCWYCDNIAGTVTILRRTREQILTEINVAAHVLFDEDADKARREDFGPHYIYRRAVDDVRDEEINDVEAFR
ncbi:MAG: hypothetical protein ACYS8W_13145 [Planctomycetota bacterium]